MEVSPTVLRHSKPTSNKMVGQQRFYDQIVIFEFLTLADSVCKDYPRTFVTSAIFGSITSFRPLYTEHI